MKIRTGFVSNSSSSSFCCQVSGTILEGYDGEYDEPTAECVMGHQFLAEYLLPANEEERDLSVNGKKKDLKQIFSSDKTKLKMLGKANDDTINELYSDHQEEIDELYEQQDSGYDLPTERCPLCQFKKIKSNDLAAYLLKKYTNGDEEAILKQIKEEFGDYVSFLTYLE